MREGSILPKWALASGGAEEFPDGNLGRRILPMHLTAQDVEQAILAYEPSDAARTAQIVREKLSLDDMTPKYEQPYRTVISRSVCDSRRDVAQLAGSLERTAPKFDLPSDVHVKA